MANASMRSPDPWIHGRSEALAGAPSDPFEVIARAYAPVQDEVDVEVPITFGAIPRDLSGTYFRNGPGRVSIGGDRYGHPFDGDGMVVRFAFDEGRVRYRNRYVRTRGFVDEQRAGRMLYRGFGSQRPGGLLANLGRTRFKNAANTSVLWHGGVLRALWEGGAPHRIDPRTLETIGVDDLGGLLRPERAIERALAPEHAFTAHPAIDPRSGELWGFGVIGGPRARLAIYRLDAEGAPIERRFVALPRLAFVHDFVLTERFLVFLLAPIAFDLARAIVGLASPVDALRRDPSLGTTVLVVPRDGGALRTIEARAGFVFHHVAGWDEGTREIVIDTLRMDDFEGGTIDVLDPAALRRVRVPRAVPTRMIVDLATRRVREEVHIDADVELPTIDPRRRTRPARIAYAVARPSGWSAISHPAIARLDLASREVHMRDLAPDLPGEPLYVPRPYAPEGEGYVLTIVYRAETHRSELWVLDARDLSTVARATLPHHVPLGFHGTFVPS
ncbi:lignostilbene-alpha,beta-dioxygenase [Sandaracinus amylolyticus]|uniref:Lignostilbene-alpha,beta-dioxygenase n=2 Tax=Sandaracinus amylolyticus TaxID=927083 RepID=A0A0F6W093_9BACT|nr:lignostilbene-alpha,beta-dioxygenase [Sandaracinus amylolyticus]